MQRETPYRIYWLFVGGLGLFALKHWGTFWANMTSGNGSPFYILATLGSIWLIIWQMDPENPRSIIKDGALTDYDQNFAKAIGKAVKEGQSSSGTNLTDYDRTRAEAIAAAARSKESEDQKQNS